MSVDRINNQWNISLIVFLICQAGLLIVWGARLETRVVTLETRGSPQVEALIQQLTIVQERQQGVIKKLDSNADRMDELRGLLLKHLGPQQ